MQEDNMHAIAPSKDQISAETLPFPGESAPIPGGLCRRFFDGFMRDPNAVQKSTSAAGPGFDIEAAAQNTASSQLQRKLKSRHLQMIAIGGSIGTLSSSSAKTATSTTPNLDPITGSLSYATQLEISIANSSYAHCLGTGLFVGSGVVLSTGGPASVLIAYVLIGAMLYATMQALGEMSVLFPVSGSFAHYSTRFIDPAWGFAMGWNYALLWLVTLPTEIVAASITVDYWNPGVSNAAWASIFWSLIVIINLFGVRGYGEAEFCFSIVKVIAVVGFIILGVILNCGGGSQGHYIGGTYWKNPGAFHNGFKGLCSVFVQAAFAFGGSELVGLASAETANPRRSIPTAIKQVFWRVALFYVVSLTLVGLLVPYDDPKLLSGSSDADAKASPFVIAIQNAGISGLPSVMNVVILVSVLSVGNSAVYASSRTLAALAEQHQAPRWMAYIDRTGRPICAIIFSSVVGLLCFLAASSKQTAAFDWMMAIAGLSSIFTWGSICLAHILFRSAWKRQGHSLDELVFRSQPGVLGSWIGFTFNCLVLVAQFWVGFAPVGYGSMSASARVENFFKTYLGAAVVIICYVGYKVWYKTLIVRSQNVDLMTGRRDINIQHIIEQEKEEQQQWSRWKKLYKLFC